MTVVALAVASSVASVSLAVVPPAVEGLPLPAQEVPTSTELVLIRSRLLTEQRMIFELRRSQRSGGEGSVRRVSAGRRLSNEALPARYGTGACGGDLPPCAVKDCESGGSLTAENPRSTASGKWQITDPTWNGHGGYSHAADAPESVQDQRAREIYAGGAGRRQWVC